MNRNQLTTFAYAKINLALSILERRFDGYHELQSVMQSIALHDRVTVSLTECGLECSCGELSGEENLAYQAARLFVDGLNLMNGIHIEIEKNIPVQAGLAGGSSDAAATLRALNELFERPYSTEQLYAIAVQLGADVAFCLEGGTQWATGVGEQLEKLPPVPRLNLILVKPKQGVNTGEAYRRFDEEGRNNPLDYKVWKDALSSGRKAEILSLLSNDLEQASMRILPEIASVKQELLQSGCQAALMSGSGSAVFGVVQSPDRGEDIATLFREKGYDVWVTHTIERGDLGWKEN